jgi:Uma2 family endonuclease
MSHAQRRADAVRDRPSRRMTMTAWAALPEDEPGELVDGYLTEEERPDLVHELVVAWFIGTLRSWIVPRGGFVFGSEAKFVVSPKRGRKPDLSVYLPGTKGLPARGAVHLPPDIMIEIVSPTPRDGRRDRVEKADEYAAFGVRFYWIVDPEQRTVEILERDRRGRYARALSLLDGSSSRVPGCTGLTLDAEALWREVDRLLANR